MEAVIGVKSFGLREKYEDPSVEYVMDGTSWELIVKGGGRSIQSEGHNKFPEQWRRLIILLRNVYQLCPWF